jgi:hypothetical protein
MDVLIALLTRVARGGIKLLGLAVDVVVETVVVVIMLVVVGIVEVVRRL